MARKKQPPVQVVKAKEQWEINNELAAQVTDAVHKGLDGNLIVKSIPHPTTANQKWRYKNPTEKQAVNRWAEGVSGNPAGRPKGSKNKLTTVKEAATRGDGLSPAEMMMEIARRQFAQETTTGDALALKVIIEANKFIEATADTKATLQDVKEMSDDEIRTEVLRLVGNDK
jgi:hypothetical protein